MTTDGVSGVRNHTKPAGLAAAATMQFMAGIVQLKIGYVNNLKLHLCECGCATMRCIYSMSQGVGA